MNLNLAAANDIIRTVSNNALRGSSDAAYDDLVATQGALVQLGDLLKDVVDFSVDDQGHTAVDFHVAPTVVTAGQAHTISVEVSFEIPALGDDPPRQAKFAFRVDVDKATFKQAVGQWRKTIDGQ